jgi:hypothetical protein
MPRIARTTLAALSALAVLAAAAPVPAVAGVGGGQLEGFLLDIDGSAASGFTLHLIDAAGRDVAQSTTADDGIYSFRDLESGSYSLGVENPQGGMAVVAAPPVQLKGNSLARRDVKLMQTDPAAPGAAFVGNPSMGLWWAGLDPTVRALTVVGGVVLLLLTISALDNGGETELSGTPITGAQ